MKLSEAQLRVLKALDQPKAFLIYGDYMAGTGPSVILKGRSVLKVRRPTMYLLIRNGLIAERCSPVGCRITAKGRRVLREAK